MNRPANRVAKIDVGTPPYASDEWETFEFHFHGFEGLPAEKGRTVKTSKVTCFGHAWWLKLYPGGDGDERAQDGSISLFLCKSSNDEGISIKYELNVLDWDGERTINNYPNTSDRFDDVNHSWGFGNFMKRSFIIDPLNNILVDGTLVVELKMMPVQKSSLPRRPFNPDNASSKKMEDLYYSGEKYADLAFVFPREKDEFGDFEPPRYYAHRAILQACAPGLAELCDPYEETKASIPLTNVNSETFQLLLRYVYGVKISAKDWKEHSQDLIDAGDRYNIPDLKLEAEAWYVRFIDITAKNVIDLLLYADAKDCPLLREYVMDYFVKNGKDALQHVPFAEIPESRSLFTDLLLALSVKNQEDEEESDSEDYKVMRICSLRRKLGSLGLDTDGSREMLIKRLEMEEKYYYSDEETAIDEEESID